MCMGQVRMRGGRERVDVLGAAGPVFLGRRHGGQAVRLERLQMALGALLGDLEVRCDLAQRGVPACLEEGEDDLALRVHDLKFTAFSTLMLKYRCGHPFVRLAGARARGLCSHTRRPSAKNLALAPGWIAACCSPPG